MKKTNLIESGFNYVVDTELLCTNANVICEKVDTGAIVILYKCNDCDDLHICFTARDSKTMRLIEPNYISSKLSHMN